MTYQEKLSNIKINKEKFEHLLAGTRFKIINYRFHIPVFTLEFNPHAYIVENTETSLIIPGLWVYLSFGSSDIAILDKPMELDGSSDYRNTMQVTMQTDKNAIIKFIQDCEDMYKNAKV